MNILIVAATQFEVQPLLTFLGIALPSPGINNANIDLEGKEIKVLITGAGMVNTALMMGKYLDDSYHMVINAGVCGAFDRGLQPGDIVQVTTDSLSEMGAEDGDGFLTYDQLNLPGEHVFFGHSEPYFMIDLLKKVEGITVNTVHGNETSIEKVKQLYQPDVESMEGAAFFAACKGLAKNYVQVRTVSNYVEKRDKSKWQMPLAIKNLNDFLITFIQNV
jgi:futalosine hydrolase